jgi:tRNA-specific 2-thiouridylase
MKTVNEMKKKVLVGMSGGVDSTVTAKLLLDAGYEVEGVYMKLHDKSGYHEENFKRVLYVAGYLGIEAKMLDLSKDFEEAVYKPFIESYQKGLTPNPCARCNRQIKFGKMIEYADEIGADYLATGHYVRHDGTYILEALDETKDQSYFLFDIDKKIIPRLIFPLGEWKKEDVKAYAAKIKALESFATQKESSEICFVETTYIDVLKEHICVDMPGEVLDIEGNVIGHHKGFMHYTIGKRRGFFVKGAHEPHYVKEILAQTNQIVVAPYSALEVRQIEIEGVNLMDDRMCFTCDVKVRYRTKRVPCHVEINEDGKALITLSEPVFGVAAGQGAVFYENDRLLGGGWITAAK